MHKNLLGCIFCFFCIFIIFYFFYIFKKDTEGFSDFKDNSDYKKQIKLLSEKYNPYSTKRRPVSELKLDPAVSNKCFVNFYSLGCRYTGFVGPLDAGYWDPDMAIQLAINAGCRVFVLDIDYVKECVDTTKTYYPRLVVRDSQGVSRIKTDIPCNNDINSNIKDVCDKINLYAFAESCGNKSDPIIIVLHFLRKPPGDFNSPLVLEYFSKVAKALSPFRNRFIDAEINNGSYYRQLQQDKILINDITDYNNKVLIFSNANTSGFRSSSIKYNTSDDLDFIVNLQLQYIQKPKSEGSITETGTGAGFLESTSNFKIVPPDMIESTVAKVTKNWTICLIDDPFKPIDSDTYNKITSTFGVQCIPTMIFDTTNSFMFSDKLFEKYSFIPKPKQLQYTKPQTVVAAKPDQSKVQANAMFR